MTLPFNTKLKKNGSEQGFTIVELLIVIIVIGILATLVLVAYSNVQNQASDSKRVSNADTLRDASEAFKSQSTNGYYPQVNPTGTTANTAGPNFQADLATLSPATVTVNSSVSALLNPSTTVALSVPSSTNPDWVQAVYCPTASSPTNQTATGITFNYYQQTKSGGTGTGGHIYTVTTGTGCP